MSTPKIDNVCAGYIFAYDAETGDLLWTHEKTVEVTRGEEEYPTPITEAECEKIRVETAGVFRDRKVEALISPEGFTLRENVQISVDLDKKILLEQEDEVPGLVDRFSNSSE